jgi:phosphate/sulfate permease
LLEGVNEYLILTFAAIGTALFFDFVNGFHDSANAIATVVGTRVLKPLHAVTIAAFANFVGPFLFGTAMATTVGNGIIEPEFSTVDIILAGQSCTYWGSGWISIDRWRLGRNNSTRGGKSPIIHDSIARSWICYSYSSGYDYHIFP